MPDDREVGISGMELRDVDDVTRIDPPFALDFAPACSLVESHLGLAGEPLELASLFLQEVRWHHLDITRRPGPPHGVESREMGVMSSREGGCHIDPRAARGVIVHVHQQILESHRYLPSIAPEDPRFDRLAGATVRTEHGAVWITWCATEPSIQRTRPDQP